MTSDMTNLYRTYEAKYSKLLGKIYLESDVTRDVLGAVPDDIKRAGFNDKTARELRKQIMGGGGLFDSSIEGELIYVAFAKRISQRLGERDYIDVGIKTFVPVGKYEPEPEHEPELEEAIIFLSLPLKTVEGLKLVYKLANSRFGEDTKLMMFQKLDKRQRVRHIVGVRQGGETVLPESLFSISDLEKLERGRTLPRASIEETYNRTLPQINRLETRYAAYRETLPAEIQEALLVREKTLVAFTLVVKDQKTHPESQQELLPNEEAENIRRSSQHDSRHWTAQEATE